MTLQQIRLGLVATCVMAASIAINLLIMQPGDGRSPRPDRNYRGLSGLPGTPSTTIDEMGALLGSAPSGSVQGVDPRRDQVAQEGDSRAQGSGLIQAVQMALAKRGYVPGNTTGRLDMVTRAAIIAFEHDRGLDLTAEPSLELMAELKSDVPLAPSASVAPRKSSAEAVDVIRVVQQSLARLNYRPGAADGVMGQATAAAIRAFERDRLLPDTGRVSGLLLTQLAQETGQGRLAQH
ncbi:MAG: peptidoglycan-binding protein [Hyphomicrobiaceae bacterium]